MNMSNTTNHMDVSKIDVLAWEGAGGMSASCSTPPPTHTRCYRFSNA